MPASPEACRLYRQRLRARVVQLLGGKCDCGNWLDLQLAHVSKTALTGPGRGMAQRYRDAMAFPLCYRLMCLDCHRKFDGVADTGPPLKLHQVEEK